MSPVEFIKEYWKLILPTLLFAMGTQLADYQIKNKVELSYEVSKLSVNDLSAVHIKISNDLTHIGVSDLTILSPSDNIIDKSFSSKSDSSEDYIWKGNLPSQSSIEGLIISGGSVSIDSSDVERLIKAKYISPGLKEKNIKAVEKGILSFNKTIMYYFYLLLPNLVWMIISLIYIKFYSKT